MNKVLKNSILAVVLAFALYNSFSIESLDQIKKSQSELEFNAASYANEFFSNKIETLQAIKGTEFLGSIFNNTSRYAEQNGEKLGISDEYHFIIEDRATIMAIEEEYIELSLENGKTLGIATDFIFGNAIRDGSRMANIDDYQNTMDFNSISVELNNIVRTTIVPPFKEKAKVGDALYFKGAVTIDITDQAVSMIKVIPLLIEFKD